jgi:hypothetical protein
MRRGALMTFGCGSRRSPNYRTQLATSVHGKSEESRKSQRTTMDHRRLAASISKIRSTGNFLQI